MTTGKNSYNSIEKNHKATYTGITSEKSLDLLLNKEKCSKQM